MVAGYQIIAARSAVGSGRLGRSTKACLIDRKMALGKEVAVVVLLTIVLNGQFAFGQSALQESTKNDPHLATGRLLAKGENKSPFGLNRLLTYKLEEVDLQ